MAPILWEYLATDLRETPSRRLETLLNHSNDILRHVRDFELFHSSMDDKLLELEFVLLLDYLPRDRLDSFTAYGVRPSIVSWLLQKQR